MRGEGRELGPGIFGLSNHLLDTPWPKVTNLKSRLLDVLDDWTDEKAVLALMRDDQPAPDEHLPRTGISLDWERLLSSAFIRAPDYGTRSTTLIQSMRTAACASMNGRGIRQERRPAESASVSPLPRSDSRMPRAMMQRFDESTHPSFGTRHVPLIRAAMKGQGLDAWIVPHTDEYQNEYLPACNERLAWATGFTGSAGAAVILRRGGDLRRWPLHPAGARSSGYGVFETAT